MNILPRYKLTHEVITLIAKIDALHQLFSSFEIPKPVQDKIRHASLLKSSLFSARIEGNPINMEDIEVTNEVQKKKEIFNILSAYYFIEKKIKSNTLITTKLILNLHNMVMKDIHTDVGLFRCEMGAIFNEAGVAIYVSPPPEKIKPLLNQLLSYINSHEEKFPLIAGIIAHLSFEKIHPFIDGNGRVGRLLISAILKSKGYDFSISIPFEEYLDEHKSEYYRSLEKGLQDPQTYLLFMLRAYYEQAEKVKKDLFQELQKKETILLPPRQEELFNIIKEHRMVSFDFLRRRFLKTPSRTLRYDLKKLVDKGFVIKIGKTKGSYYCIKKNKLF